ncbi:hypothetical protein Golax_007614, partial [Gossypium laxum]|nr:hypothetical protein [Gossypium laxum]
MKSLFFSMLFLLSFLFFLANNGEAAVPCTTVDANAAACLGFATGMAAKPSDACCNGLRQLAQTVKSVDDKKAICRCLKVGAKSLGIQDRFLSMIPQACNIKVDFPVSVNTNCETKLVSSSIVEGNVLMSRFCPQPLWKVIIRFTEGKPQLVELRPARTQGRT